MTFICFVGFLMPLNLSLASRKPSKIATFPDKERPWTKPGELYTRADILSGFPELLARYNVDCTALLDEVGISPHALSNPHLFISWERHCRFAELAAVRCGEPDLGLRHAQMRPFDLPVSNSGPLVMLAQFCSTLEDWLEMAVRYARYHTNGWIPYLAFDEKGQAIFRCLDSPAFPMPRQVAEGLAATLFLLVQYIGQRPDLTCSVVRFRHGEPEDMRPHRYLFGSPVEFGQRYIEFVFDAEYLKLPVSSGFRPFRKLIDVYMRRQLRQTAARQGTISAALLIAIPPLLGTELCTAARVADSLGMSEKKMQRLLNAEGQSFRNILSLVRKDIAVKMLTHSNVPIDIISGMLGYASNAAFTLAFDSWCGQSPSSFRKAEKERVLILESTVSS